jgi:hypothetical protein
VRRVVFPSPRPFFETWLNPADDDASTKMQAQKAMLDALPEDARRMFRFSFMFEQIKNGDAMTLLPFDLTIK